MQKAIPIHVHAGAPAASRDEPSQGIAGPPPIWLWVGDTGIDEAAIAREMQHHRGSDPHQVRLDAARALVVRELLAREVARQGIEPRPQDGESAEEAAVRELIERDIEVPSATEADCRRWFAQNPERLRRPDRVRARHVLLAAPPADAAGRASARARGEALIAELRQHPERFTEYAQRFSDCPSKDQGGELGWVERGDTTPEFERQLFMLKPGLAGLTVETRYGHHVVCVDEQVRGEALGFEEAAPRIAAYLETQVRQNALNQYLHQLAERYGVRGLEDLAPN